MKKIVRSNVLPNFMSFVTQQHPNNWHDDFVHFNHDLYVQCLNTLESDQHHLSTYTELRLSSNNGIKHIDHFLKRNLFPQHTFVWDNLFVDDHSKDYGSDYKDSSHLSQQENQDLIYPAKDDPQNFLSFQSNGKMIPLHGLNNTDSNRATLTIDKFNLNHPFLMKKRRDLMLLIDNSRKRGLTDAGITTALSGFGLTSFIEFVL